jgi:large subunit ribosomal protein L10
MDKSQKEQLVAELKEQVVGKLGVFLTEYQGMTVEQMYALRREFDKVGTGYRVVKNTLAKKAFEGTDYEFLAKDLTGTIAIAYSADPIAPAKVIAKALKSYDKLKLKGGYLGGSPVNPKDIDAISQLPGKDELRASLLSVLNAPGTKFVNVLAAVPRHILNVLNAREKQLAG